MRGYLRMQGGPLRKAACFAPVCVLLLCSAFMPSGLAFYVCQS